MCKRFLCALFVLLLSMTLLCGCSQLSGVLNPEVNASTSYTVTGKIQTLLPKEESDCDYVEVTLMNYQMSPINDLSYREFKHEAYNIEYQLGSNSYENMTTQCYAQSTEYTTTAIITDIEGENARLYRSIKRAKKEDSLVQLSIRGNEIYHVEVRTLSEKPADGIEWEKPIVGEIPAQGYVNMDLNDLSRDENTAWEELTGGIYPYVSWYYSNQYAYMFCESISGNRASCEVTPANSYSTIACYIVNLLEGCSKGMMYLELSEGSHIFFNAIDGTYALIDADKLIFDTKAGTIRADVYAYYGDLDYFDSTEVEVLVQRNEEEIYEGSTVISEYARDTLLVDYGIQTAYRLFQYDAESNQILEPNPGVYHFDEEDCYYTTYMVRLEGEIKSVHPIGINVYDKILYYETEEEPGEIQSSDEFWFEATYEEDAEVTEGVSAEEEE